MDWWTANLPARIEEFKKWTAGPNDETRLPTRKIVKDKGYKSVLDVGCGLCADRDGFINDGYTIQYTGVDICEELLYRAEERKIKVVKASVESLPFSNNQFEVVMCRSVLEHLPNYKTAIQEMLRVAKYEVLVTWFIPPTEQEEKTVKSSENGGVIWHNRYCKHDMNIFLSTVCTWFEWIQLPHKFVLLRILKG